jgi:TorA maturation chaperone TorD
VQVTSGEQRTVERALQRSFMYRFLSLAWRPPAEGFATATRGDAWRTVGRAAQVAGAAAAVEAARVACGDQILDALTDEYHRVFGHQVGLECPLYEALYASGDVFAQAQCLADIAAFYHAFGLDMGEEIRERPDHLSVELEFMHTLGYREAYARAHHGPARVALLVDAQRAFLRDHLARWSSAFSRLVSRRAKGPYGALAALLSEWVAGEVRALGVGPLDDLEPPPIDASAFEKTQSVCGGCPLEPRP